MSGGRVKTVALYQNELICLSTAKRQKQICSKLHIKWLVKCGRFTLSKVGTKRYFSMRLFGSVVLQKIV